MQDVEKLVAAARKAVEEWKDTGIVSLQTIGALMEGLDPFDPEKR